MMDVAIAKVRSAATLVTLERVVICAVVAFLAMAFLVAPAEAQVNVSGAANKIIGFIGLFVLVLCLGYGAMKIGRGSVVPALVIILLGAIFYYLTTNAKGVLGPLGQWLFGLFGL